MPSHGNTQYIGGQEYTIGTPEWQNAYNQFNAGQAKSEGTTQAAGQAPVTQVATDASKQLAAQAHEFQTASQTSSQQSAQQLQAQSEQARQQEAMFGAQAAQQHSEQEYQLNQKAANAALGRTQQLIGGLGGAGGGSLYGGGALPTGMTADETAARNAAFARAKDTSGLLSRSAIQGLHESMASRGLLGSGMESAGLGQIFNGASSDLGNVNRDQMLADYSRIGQVADRNYQGGLTARGQDMTMRNSLIGLLNSGSQGMLY